MYNFWNLPICTGAEDDDEVVDSNIRNTHSLMAPFFAGVSETGGFTAADFSPPQWLSVIAF